MSVSLGRGRPRAAPLLLCTSLYTKGTRRTGPRVRESGRWKVEARKDGTTVHTTWCRADSAHLEQFVHSVVRTVVSCTDMLCVYVVHVSRTRAVLRFALLRSASRTALATYLLGLGAKEATWARVHCGAARSQCVWCSACGPFARVGFSRV